MMDAVDKAIIYHLSGDLLLQEAPFQALSQEIGISEGELLERLRKMQVSGALKRIAPVLHHYRTPYTCNGMAAWVVPEAKLEQINTLMQGCDQISHIYERENQENWPYNFYSMIHGKSREEIEGLVCRIAESVEIEDFIILYTVREWKKTSPPFSELLPLCRNVKVKL